MRNHAVLLLVVALTAATLPARAGWDSDNKAWMAVYDRMQPLEKTDPQRAVEAYRLFIQQNPGLNDDIAGEAVAAIIRLEYDGLKQTEVALQICDWGIKKYAGMVGGARLLTAKAAVLAAEERYPEVSTLIEADWAGLMVGNPRYTSEALRYYCTALEAQGQKEKAGAALRKALFDNATLLDQFGQRPTEGWLYEYIVDDYISRNQYDEALRWAKLGWVTCRCEAAEKMAGLLKRVWVARDLSDRAFEAFTLAQADPAKPNPLADVKLPEADPKALREQWGRLGWFWLGQVDALIVMGDPGGAMVLARQTLLDDTKSGRGTTVIGAVFKAGDLSLRRVKAFRAYRETGQGPNPVDEFLKQYPPKE